MDVPLRRVWSCCGHINRDVGSPRPPEPPCQREGPDPGKPSTSAYRDQEKESGGGSPTGGASKCKKPTEARNWNWGGWRARVGYKASADLESLWSKRSFALICTKDPWNNNGNSIKLYSLSWSVLVLGLVPGVTRQGGGSVTKMPMTPSVWLVHLP